MNTPLHLSPGRRDGAFRRAVRFVFLLPVLAVAAPPIITITSPEQHYYFVPEERSAVQFGYLIVASNSPASYDAIGLPPNASINRSTGAISGGLDVPGVFPLTLSATNADGTGMAQVRLMIHPAFVGVSTSRGEFAPGQSVTITLTCNRPVFVTGRPAVSFTGISGSRAATYLSGSGTSTLVFGGSHAFTRSHVDVGTTRHV